MGIPWKLKSTLRSSSGCHQTKRLLPSLSGQLKGLGRRFPSPLLPSKGKKRCRATTIEESHHHLLPWESSYHVSELLLSYRDEKWMLTRFLSFSPCPEAGGYTIPHDGRNLVGVIAVGGKWLLFESNQATDCFFLFLPCLEGLCHWVPSCLSFSPPFLKTHRSSHRVIHGIKWECRAGMSSKAHKLLKVLQKQPIEVLFPLHWYSE